MTKPIRSTRFFAAVVARQSLVALALIAAMTMASHSTRGNAQSGAQAVDGDLDSTFGDGGIVKTDFSGNFDWIGAIAVQSDGKIVVAGATSNSARVLSFALARYKTDGSLDESFGSGGRVVTGAGGLASADSLAVLQDGKILAGGIAFGRGQDFAMARYNNVGALDSSFGINGFPIWLYRDAVRLVAIAEEISRYFPAGAKTRIQSAIATASIEALSAGKSFSIFDSNHHDDTCACR